MFKYFVVALLLLVSLTSLTAQEVTPPFGTETPVSETEVPVETPSPEATETVIIGDDVVYVGGEIPVTDKVVVEVGTLIWSVAGALLTGLSVGGISVFYILRSINQNKTLVRVLEGMANRLPLESRERLYQIALGVDEIAELGKQVFDGKETSTEAVG